MTESKTLGMTESKTLGMTENKKLGMTERSAFRYDRSERQGVCVAGEEEKRKTNRKNLPFYFFDSIIKKTAAKNYLLRCSRR